MVRQQNVRVGGGREQLVLALGEQGPHSACAAAITSALARHRPPRDARGRFVAGIGSVPKAARERAVPPRDSRGRFVAYPTSDAPSWYVFCSAGYRILGEPPPAVAPPVAPAAPPALPRAVIRHRRDPLISRGDLETMLFAAILVLLAALYLWHRGPPHR